MHKHFRPSAIILAMSSLFAHHAIAQSSVTIYGTMDLSLDSIHKSQGNVQGTVFGLSGVTPVPNSVASPAQTMTRIGTSLTGQSHFGLKGVEDLGGGWLAKFQLESAIVPDTGGLGSDGRLFGRMAWVGVTTPLGELRMGRQAAPMLAGYYLNSLERLGTTDLIGAGVIVNNLQIYQDNMLSYTARSGGWVGQASYSPNAGVASRVSAARASATTSTPVATPTTGQIVGGATAGSESDTNRGRTYGALGAYLGHNWKLIGAYHSNDFNAPVGLATTAGGFVPLFSINSYHAYMLGATYNFESSGTQLAVNHHDGQYKDSSGANPKVSTWSMAVKQTLGQFDLIGQVAHGEFTNFTQGKDVTLMFGADYNLSRRTAIYVRAGQLKDSRGSIVRAALTPVGLAGGPSVLLVPLGAVEIPLFSGAGASMDATTRLVGVGIRHSF